MSEVEVESEVTRVWEAQFEVDCVGIHWHLFTGLEQCLRCLGCLGITRFNALVRLYLRHPGSEFRLYILIIKAQVLILFLT